MEYIMYFDDIERQLHAIININQMFIEKIQKKRKLVIFWVYDGTIKYADYITKIDYQNIIINIPSTVKVKT